MFLAKEVSTRERKREKRKRKKRENERGSKQRGMESEDVLRSTELMALEQLEYWLKM